ncbi:unnamed protein product, partial [Thlaspi arvense]
KSDDSPLHEKNKPFPKGGYNGVAGDDHRRNGFVYVKGFQVDGDEEYSAIQEARSLNAIRTALENLEDQLEFLHTVHVQQRAERDAAIASLEQSRIVLAMRLAEHQGKKYKVIEEARAFVGDVRDAGCFVSSNDHHGSASHEGKTSSSLIKFLVTSFNFAKESLKIDQVGGILGNAALFTLSMLALLHLNQRSSKVKYITDYPQKQEDLIYKKNLGRISRADGSSTSCTLSQLDVMLARG